jgi:hypothetical protein
MNFIIVSSVSKLNTKRRVVKCSPKSGERIFKMRFFYFLRFYRLYLFCMFVYCWCKSCSRTIQTALFFIQWMCISQGGLSLNLVKLPNFNHLLYLLLCYSVSPFIQPNECYRTSRAWVVSTPASCSRATGLKSRSGNQLSWLRFFVIFLGPTRQISNITLN